MYWMRYTGRSRHAAFAPISKSGDAVKLEVMILGEQGSGKTVYLAGLHGAMGSAQVEIPVTLRIDDARRVILDNVFSQVIRPDYPKFPAGTPWGVNEWVFDCVVTGSDNNEFVPFSVAYADYAGEMINPQKSLEELGADPGMQQFFNREKTAHAFLILIDGHKLYRLLKGDQTLTYWLDDYLPRVLQMITRGRPVHFAVTKWGILERDGVTLEVVRETLLAQRTLKGFAEFKQLRGSIVRLIPVDVVGPFGKLNDEGVMVKDPQARVTPMNLLVPFAALLPDIIRHKLTETTIIVNRSANGGAAARKPRFLQLREQVGKQLLTLLQQNHRIILKQAEDPLVKFVTDLFQHTGGPSPAKERRTEAARNAVRETISFLDRYFAQVEEQLTRQQEQLRRELNEKQTRIDSERAAVELAIAACTARLQQFEQEYPASLLHASQS
jgi:hypothetical protein